MLTGSTGQGGASDAWVPVIQRGCEWASGANGCMSSLCLSARESKAGAWPSCPFSLQGSQSVSSAEGLGRPPPSLT